MAGRPTVRTPEVDTKIEQAAALGASYEEIAFYAGIHRNTLYRWAQEDEELKGRIEELQQQPILKARQTVIQSLGDPDRAFRYLERKRKAEFSLRTETDVTSGGEALDSATADSVKELSEKFDELFKQHTDNG